MADSSDISDGLAAAIAAVMYPNGTAGQLSAAGAPVRIYPGWPMQAKLDADLKAGIINITIYPMPSGRSPDSYITEWREIARVAETVEVEISGETITFSGDIAVPQNVAVVAMDKTITRAIQPGDTLATLAAGLATLATAAGITASSSGAALTVSGLRSAQVGTIGTLAREVARMDKPFMVTIWAPTHTDRTAAARIVGGMLARTWHMAMPDGSKARLSLVRDADNDNPQEALLYRRDFVVDATYQIIETEEGFEVVTFEAALESAHRIDRDGVTKTISGVVPQP